MCIRLEGFRRMRNRRYPVPDRRSQAVRFPIASRFASFRHVPVGAQDCCFPRGAETPDLLSEPIPDERRVSRSLIAGVVSAEPLDGTQALRLGRSSGPTGERGSHNEGSVN